MIFRIFYKLSFLGRFTADVALAVFLVCLLFPILPATGMINHPSGSTVFQSKYLLALISEPILSDILFALGISFCVAFLMVNLALIVGYFSFQSFTGKFTLLGLVSFFMIMPDSISFLLGAPFISIFGKRNLYLLTYASSFSWGFAVALISVYSFLNGVRKTEIKTLHMLGGNHQQILATYIFPRAIPYLVYGCVTLSCLFSLQGLYTFQQVTGRKSLLTYHLTRPLEFFNDPGPGSAIYLILFCIAILGSLLITRYSSLEFRLAKALDNTGYIKKVRRRKSKKKSKKKPKIKENKITPESTKEGVNSAELEENKDADSCSKPDLVEDAEKKQTEAGK